MANPLLLIQKLEVNMNLEPATWPGGWPGIYGGDYKNLTRIYQHLASARIAVANGSLAVAEVSACNHCCLYTLIKGSRVLKGYRVHLEDDTHHCCSSQCT